MSDDKKLIDEQKEWHEVSKELEAEDIKLAYYDNTLIPLLGDLAGKKVLDYGAGPGVLATALQKLGADMKTYDINPEMNKSAGEKIGEENVFYNIEDIPKNFFDFVICNLVVCIVPDNEVRKVLENIKSVLSDTGFAYVGFCNPKIFNIEESNVDFRFPTGDTYETNHRYKKVKKEGDYEIIEDHRPIEWYKEAYKESGLELVDTIFTPEYELNGKHIEDFAIFKLRRV